MTGRAAFRRKRWTASFFFFLLCKFVYRRLSSWFLSILNIHHAPKESNLRQKNNKCRATAICWSSAKFVCGREWGAAPANKAAEGPAQERERQASARSLARKSHSREGGSAIWCLRRRHLPCPRVRLRRPRVRLRRPRLSRQRRGVEED